MESLVGLLYILIGIVLLYAGGELLVRSSIRIAHHFRIQSFIVGMTFAAFATSMPEAVTSAIAQIQENLGNMALGNIMGSNLANLGLVLGICALIRPIKVAEFAKIRDLPILFMLTLLLGSYMIIFRISRLDGIILLMNMVLVVGWQVHTELKSKRGNKPIKVKGNAFAIQWILGIVGMVVLTGGAYLLIEGGTIVARLFNISDRVIGLTILAVGTSLPELGTSVVATVHRHEGVALGNLIGSNIFNTLFITGICSLIRPIVFSQKFFIYDLPILLFFTVLLWAMIVFRPIINRLMGFLLLLFYCSYIVLLIFI